MCISCVLDLFSELNELKKKAVYNLYMLKSRPSKY